MVESDSPNRLIDRRQAAAYCGVTPTTFSSWVARGTMPSAVFGTRRWDMRSIDRYLDVIAGLNPNNDNHRKPKSELDAWIETH